MGLVILNTNATNHQSKGTLKMNTWTKYIQSLADKIPSAEIIGADRVERLINSRQGGVRLSIDGNCGCALLGPNLQEGEAEFVEIDESELNDGYENAANRATIRALWRLTARCYPKGDHSLPYYTGDHPFLNRT